MPAMKILAMLATQGMEGDDALLRLAQRRLEEAGLGAELYPETVEQLRQQLAFCPTGRPCTAHLPRDINLLRPEDRERMLAYAAEATGRLEGVLVHDHGQFAEWPDRAEAALREADQRLARLPRAPRLFVEYASGLPLDCFALLFENTRDLQHVSAAVDISHVGIQVCRNLYEQSFPRVDICSLATSADLPQQIDAIQRTVAQARPVVVALVQRLVRVGNPLHFHLHDGHPLSTLSRWGVADHLSFLQEIRLPFTYQGRQRAEGLFGPVGLSEILRTARRGLAWEQLTFLIEVHPQEGRIPLGVYAPLFAHWENRTNAERMNYWLEMLEQTAYLLRTIGSEPGA